MTFSRHLIALTGYKNQKNLKKSFFAQIICHCGFQAKSLILGHIKAQSYAKITWFHSVHPCERKLEASMHPQLPFIRYSHLHNRCQQICNSKSSHKHDFSSTFWQFFRWIWSSWPGWWTKTSNWWYWVVYMFRKPLELMKNEPTLMQKYSENLVRPLTFSAS